MGDIVINSDLFFQRLERLTTHLSTHKGSIWGGVDAITIPLGSSGEDELNYSKSAALHLYLFGYELPDSIIVLSRNQLYFMATAKKCNIVKSSLQSTSSMSINVLEKTKDEGQNRENLNALINVVRRGGGKKLGGLMKDKYNGAFIPSWLSVIEQSQLEIFEINTALGLFLSVKDEAEQVRDIVGLRSMLIEGITGTRMVS